jgi:hypothetical protein
MGGKKKDTDDWLADIAGDLKGIKDGPAVIVEWLDGKFGPILEVMRLIKKKLETAGVTYEKAAGHGEALLAASPLGLLFRR